jgi:tRNA (guanine37-N1)-methyltransferase
MKIDILTLFPEMFDGPFSESMIKRAQEKGLVDIKVRNLRDWATDKHKTVDDKPYGGGAGMVLRVDVVEKALDELKTKSEKLKTITNSSKQSTFKHRSLTILLSPQGQIFSQAKARKLSKLDHIILIAGHYEGFDQRIRDHLTDEEISIGDYVLTGGEIPAMVLVDSIVRLIPGVLGDEQSLKDETHSKKGFKKYPVYTRPENYKGWKVPEVLLSGNHSEIDKWRDKHNKK